MADTEIRTAGDLFGAAERFFWDHLTEEDEDHRNVTEMHDLFSMSVLEEFARAVFDREDLGRCIGRALSHMPDAMDGARECADDDRE